MSTKKRKKLAGNHPSHRASRSSMRASEIFERLNQRWPDAHCELVHHNDFQLLVAVVLSAQTTDVSVNKCFGAYVNQNPDFGARELVRMGEKRFAHLIRTIGLAPTKARNASAIARRLLNDFEGRVPRERGDLESLPGVGRKTANVVLNVLYGEPTMAVDTHVARLAVRMGFSIPSASRERIEEDLLRIVPGHLAHNAHHSMIFHGRYLCTAKKPDCESCPLDDICPKVGVIPKAQTPTAAESIKRRNLDSPSKAPRLAMKIQS